MSFSAIDELKKGNTSFLYDITNYDRKNLSKAIRVREDKNEIINNFLKDTIDLFSSFTFDIIYDNEDFKNEVLYLIDELDLINNLDEEKIRRFIITSHGREYILNNLDYFINKKNKSYDYILEHIFLDIEENKDFIEKLYIHQDLNIRAKFMKYLIDNHIEKIDYIYDDITKYFTSYTHQEYEQLTFLPTKMDTKDVSEIAVKLFEKKESKEYYQKVKKIILDNYQENDLARFLLQDKKNYMSNNSFSYKENKLGIKEFSNDSDRLFSTSKTAKILIMNRYSEFITKELMEEFKKYISLFKIGNKYSYILDNIYYYGLGNILQRHIEKYLDLSKDKETKFVDKGSCNHCFKIGDYAIKLVSSKWSYEQEICPNLYLILKNIEEEYIRNDKGIILVGIEVQKFLTKKVEDLTVDSYINFDKNLKELGYYHMDSLMNGTKGDNCMMLDSYLDADYPNPELLPVEFKKDPIVLVDRDLVFKNDNEYPKRLVSSHY